MYCTELGRMFAHSQDFPTSRYYYRQAVSAMSDISLSLSETNELQCEVLTAYLYDNG